MKRRAFVTQGTVAAASLAAISTLACKVDNKSKPVITGEQPESNDDFELHEITIRELQDKMTNGQYTAEAITSLYLKRIEALDKNGPKLNAVIELNPDALAIAKAMDDERKAGNVRGPLHGIPILIKDNINTADKMMTTAGSLALVGNVAAKDAFIVSRLREAGAVLLGKTNLSEWANFRSTKSCSGWSSRGGQTKMPYYIDRNPCGSSSGSGAAVSSNLCAIAIGTETDGSITCPASTNGVVGIKPTVGLWSRSGIIPISFTQDTAGPLTRTVTDTAILLSALTGVDASDEKTKASEGKAVKDYTTFLDFKGLQGKRIGVDKKKYENQFLNRLQQQVVDDLKKLGAEVIEVEYVDKINALGDEEFEMMKFEFKDGLNKYLATANVAPKTLKDLIDFNTKHEDEAMPTFKQDVFVDSEKKAGLDSKEYRDLVTKTNLGSQKIIDDVMKTNKLDALAGITMGPACAIDTIYGDRWGDVFLTAPAAMSGYPHISVPAGFVYDLPVGFSFFGTAWSEGQLISMAYAYEQATKHRKKPEFKKSFLS
jgi:amidase